MTQQIYWNKKYAIGHSLIDAEHQKLLQLANEVYSIQKPEKEAAKIKKCVHELCEYIKYHFEHEQELMDKSLYLDIFRHVKLHEAIIAEMNDVLANSKDLNELRSALYNLVTKWVFNHIIREDGEIVWAWCEQL